MYTNNSNDAFQSPGLRPAPQQSGDDVPEWVLRRVDDAMTEHSFKIQASIEEMHRKLEDQGASVSQCQKQTSENMEFFSKFMQALREEQQKRRQFERRLEDIELRLENCLPGELGPGGELPGGVTPSGGSVKDSPRLPVEGQQNLLKRCDEIEKYFTHFDELFKLNNKQQAKFDQVEKRYGTLSMEIDLLEKKLQIEGVEAQIYSLSTHALTDMERDNAHEDLTKKLQKKKTALSTLYGEIQDVPPPTATKDTVKVGGDPLRDKLDFIQEKQKAVAVQPKKSSLGSMMNKFSGGRG